MVQGWQLIIEVHSWLLTNVFDMTEDFLSANFRTSCLNRFQTTLATAHTVVVHTLMMERSCRQQWRYLLHQRLASLRGDLLFLLTGYKCFAVQAIAHRRKLCQLFRQFSCIVYNFIAIAVALKTWLVDWERFHLQRDLLPDFDPMLVPGA